MTRQVFCLKLKKEAEGLLEPPMDTPLGERIYDNISKEAWGLWLKHQTKLINEQRLNLTDAKARALLINELDQFLFDENV